MKKYIKIYLFILLSSMNVNCQSTKKLTFQSIEKDLIIFLIKNKDIMENEIKDYYNGKKHLNIFGIQNKYFF